MSNRNWKRGQINVFSTQSFSGKDAERQPIKGYVYEGNLWCVHKSQNNMWLISSVPIGKALVTNLKSKKHALKVFEKTIQKFPTLLTVENENYWKVILKFYGTRVKEYVSLVASEET